MGIAGGIAGALAGPGAAAAALAIYVANPLAFSPWAGLYGVNARVFGALLCNASVVSMVFAESLHVPLLFAVPILLTPLVVLSSQFGVQSLLVAGFSISIYYQSMVPLGSILMGAVVAIVVTRGKAFAIMKGHFWHVTFYGIFLQFHSVATVFRNHGVFRWILKMFRERQGIESILWVPLVRVFVWNPWLIFLFFLIQDSFVFSMVNKGLLMIIFTSLVIIPIITMRGMRFLGEADRYFTFISTVPLVVLVAIHSENASILYWTGYGLLLTIGAVTSAFMILKRSKIKHQESEEPEIETAAVLEKLVSEDPGRVLVIPQNRSDKLACFCNCEFVGIHTNVTWDRSKWPVYFSIFQKFYPYPISSIDHLKKAFGVKYIVVAKRFLVPSYLSRHHLTEEVVWRPDVKPEMESDNYSIHVI